MLGVGSYASRSNPWLEVYAYRRALPNRTARNQEAAAQAAQSTAPSSAARTVSAAQRAVSGAEVRIPTEADLGDAREILARMRIHFPGAASDGVPQAADAAADAAEGPEGRGIQDPDAPAAVMEETECQTCARRKYQDGSDDPGVSFKTPTNLDPDQAAMAVRSHEQEHVVRERAEAQREGRKVLSQSVTIHTEICPECGRVYVSGGVTRTVTAPDDTAREQNPWEAAPALQTAQTAPSEPPDPFQAAPQVPMAETSVFAAQT